MKKIIITATVGAILVISFGGASTGDQPPTISPPIEHSATVTFVIPVGTVCPRSIDIQNSVTPAFAEGDTVMVAVHCNDCRMGVYSVGEDSKEYCTYCKSPRSKE